MWISYFRVVAEGSWRLLYSNNDQAYYSCCLLSRKRDTGGMLTVCALCAALGLTRGESWFLSRTRLLWSRDYSITTKRTVRFVLSFVNHGENAQDGEACLAWLPARCCLVSAALASCSLHGEKIVLLPCCSCGLADGLVSKMQV